MIQCEKDKFNSDEKQMGDLGPLADPHLLKTGDMCWIWSFDAPKIMDLSI